MSFSFKMFSISSLNYLKLNNSIDITSYEKLTFWHTCRHHLKFCLRPKDEFQNDDKIKIALSIWETTLRLAQCRNDSLKIDGTKQS